MYTYYLDRLLNDPSFLKQIKYRHNKGSATYVPAGLFFYLNIFLLLSLSPRKKFFGKISIDRGIIAIEAGFISTIAINHNFFTLPCVITSISLLPTVVRDIMITIGIQYWALLIDNHCILYCGCLAVFTTAESSENTAMYYISIVRDLYNRVILRDFPYWCI